MLWPFPLLHEFDLRTMHSFTRDQRESMSRKQKVVCVTGASGYIASWLVKLLLQHGYTVKATVRDPKDSKKVEHLLELEGAKERLQLFKANLLEEGCFDAAVDGCEGVFHTASPVPTSPIPSKTAVVDPAVKGTLNVLKSCAKVASIKRVVITSSMGAVLYNGKPLTSDVVVDETWFSDPAFCDQNQLWYMLSKTLAEEAAWNLAKEKGIELIAINSGFAIGPPLQPVLTSTAQAILNFIKGNAISTIPKYSLVDVRDVALAHIQAFEIPSARGRYCLVGRVIRWFDLCKTLNELYPTLHLSETSEDKKASEPTHQISKEKAKSLGINFVPLELSLKDTIESFKEKGFLSI